MSKQPTVTTIASGFYSTSALNNNFTAIRDQFDNTLSLDGSTPNAMSADLDLNSNDILNGGAGNFSSLYLAGSQVVSVGTLFSFEGAWLTSTAYAVNDVVTNSGSTYLCLVAHTSGTFATDLAANKWVVLIDSSSYLLAANDLSDLNSAATARTNLGLGTIATQSSTSVNIDGGNIDGTTIGATTPAAGSFTTADIDGGTIDGATIGGATPGAGTFSTMNITGGTSGDVLYHNGTSYVRLAKGTAYQSLGMNSGATAPQWLTPDWVEITRWTYSSGTPASVTFTDLSGYNDIRVIFAGTAVTGAVGGIEVSTDNGSSWVTSGYASSVMDPTTYTDSTTRFEILRGASGTMRGNVALLNFGNSDDVTQDGAIRVNSARVSFSAGGLSSAACNALRVINSGAFTGGAIVIQGQGRV